MTSILSAKPMHKPMKMPIAKAESVGMSTEVLSRIDEAMQEQIDAGLIRGGGATIVARRGKVVHFSTHGTMDVETKTGRAMERDALYIMASSAKPLIGIATLMLVDEGLISLTDPISKFIPEFANQKVVLQAKQVKGDGKKEWRKGTVDNKGKGKQWDKSKGMAKKRQGRCSSTAYRTCRDAGDDSSSTYAYVWSHAWWNQIHQSGFAGDLRSQARAGAANFPTWDTMGLRQCGHP
jgi:hypothetical protein